MILKIKTFILLIAILVGCQKTAPQPFKLYEKFKDRRDLYCAKSKEEYRKNKFVVDECDGAGFTSLYATACSDNEVDLNVFQDETGRMHRSPDHTHCWNYDLSKDENIALGNDSGFSKDHVLMRMIAAREANDIIWIHSFYDYLIKNQFVFCDAKDLITYTSKCILSGGLYLNLAKIHLGYTLSNQSEDAAGIKEGFEGHLHVLSIWLNWRINKAITSTDVGYLRQYAKKEPLNALYQAMAYHFMQATEDDVIKAFDNNDHWPRDRLPNNHENHCSEYLFQRNMSSSGDWMTCPDKEFQEFSGTDYVFAYYVLKAT